jgi:hypothetical protein
VVRAVDRDEVRDEVVGVILPQPLARKRAAEAVPDDVDAL